MNSYCSAFGRLLILLEGCHLGSALMSNLDRSEQLGLLTELPVDSKKIMS